VNNATGLDMEHVEKLSDIEDFLGLRQEFSLADRGFGTYTPPANIFRRI
jgi:hypothetical protein